MSKESRTPAAPRTPAEPRTPVEPRTSSNAKPRGRKGAGLVAARRIVQICALVLFAMPLFAAGWSILGLVPSPEEPMATPAEGLLWGSFSASQVGPITLMDPFAALQVVCAAKTLAIRGLVGAVLVLVVYGLIKGRSFCGWVCPVNFLLEGVDWLRARLGIKVCELPVPRRAKILVAFGVLALSAVLSIPLFEAVSPIGALNRALLFGSLLGVVTLVAIVAVELFWAHRVWCRSLCPLGGFYQVIGTLGLFSVKIDHDACINCGKCKSACLSDPAILDDAVAGERNRVCSGDCLLCASCIKACPTDALSLGVAAPEHPTL